MTLLRTPEGLRAECGACAAVSAPAERGALVRERVKLAGWTRGYDGTQETWRCPACRRTRPPGFDSILERGRMIAEELTESGRAAGLLTADQRFVFETQPLLPDPNQEVPDA